MNAAAGSRSATSRGHRNAPLTPEGRLRLCLRGDAGRPIAHVAAEAGISRRCLAKWYARWRAHGENGLLDHSSRPATSPARTPEDIADLVEALRRQTKHGPARLAADPQRLHGVTLAPATVHRLLVGRGLNRLRDLDPRPASSCARSSATSTTGSATWSTSTSRSSDASRPAAADGCTASAPSPLDRLRTHQDSPTRLAVPSLP
ncbi:helix-turn-helix domain-containing protein [Streptomyces sp. NPDC059851]|uniref:helix-turn-helix domain-containing protein n=1 Tax=Streptomyces sp. NPDC059851 TaxID=3346971 RepID=UPI00365A4D29